MFDADVRNLLETLDPNARDALRRVLIHALLLWTIILVALTFVAVVLIAWQVKQGRDARDRKRPWPARLAL